MAIKDVEALEKEWWASELVAAWFGPKPGGVREVSEKAKASMREKEKEMERVGFWEGESTMRRDKSHVRLYDDD